MSFWDREVSIWRMSRGLESLAEGIDAPKHRLVAKVLVQVRSHQHERLFGMRF